MTLPLLIINLVLESIEVLKGEHSLQINISKFLNIMCMRYSNTLIQLFTSYFMNYIILSNIFFIENFDGKNFFVQLLYFG